MKRFLRILLVLLLSLSGCQKDKTHNNDSTPFPVKISLSGNNQTVDTKLFLGTPKEKSIPFLWSDGDDLGLYVLSDGLPVPGSQNIKATMDPAFATENDGYPYFSYFSAEINGLAPSRNYHLDIYYPYNNAEMFPTDIRHKISFYQVQRKANISDHLGGSGAFATAELSFKTPASLENYSPQMNFVLTHRSACILFLVNSESAYTGWNLKRITVTATDGTYLAGNTTWNMITKQYTLDETPERNSSITLDILSGADLSSAPVKAAMVVFPADMKNKSLTFSYTLENSTTTERVTLHRVRSFGGDTRIFREGTVYNLTETIPSSADGTLWIKDIYPSDSWKYSPPGKWGYKSTFGQEVNSFIERNMTTTGLMVVVGGEVIHSYGNLSELSYLASCRKSILSMMYGKYVENGTIELSRSINSLGIDDVGGLLPLEKTATILNCITARSGVYHPASNSGDDSSYAPARGSKTPGTWFLYNNWDFNVAGTIFENLTGRGIYSVFQSDLAVPLQFQDFSLSAQRKGGTLSISFFPAYHFYLSARDMARLGYLMLRKGRWNNTRIISESWVETITSAYTKVNDMNPPFRRDKGFGYGYMWWVWDGSANNGAYRNGYTAIGAGGQFLTVLPALDMVIVQKTSSNNNIADKYWQLVQLITELQIDK